MLLRIIRNNKHKTQTGITSTAGCHLDLDRHTGDMLWLLWRYSGEGGAANINNNKIQTFCLYFYSISSYNIVVIINLRTIFLPL